MRDGVGVWGPSTLTRLCALSLCHFGDAWADVELLGVCDDVNFRTGRFWRGGRAARVGYGNVRACQAPE